MSDSWDTKQLQPDLQAVYEVSFSGEKLFLFGLWLFEPEMRHETVECECYCHSIMPSLVETLVILFCSDRASEPESEVLSRCLFPTDFTDLHGWAHGVCGISRMGVSRGFRRLSTNKSVFICVICGTGMFRKCPKVGALSICCLSCRQYAKLCFTKIYMLVATVSAIDAA